MRVSCTAGDLVENNSFTSSFNLMPFVLLVFIIIILFIDIRLFSFHLLVAQLW